MAGPPPAPEPGPPPAPEPATAAARMPQVASLWRRQPLRVRLVALFTVLLLLALVAFGTVALTLLRRTLVGEIDDQLRTQAEAVVTAAQRQNLPGPDSHDLVPTDYVVIIRYLDGSSQTFGSTGPGGELDEDDLPDVGDLAVDQVQERGGRPYAVGSVASSSRWRVQEGLLRDPVSGDVVGTAAVALPLTSVDATMSQMMTWLVVVSTAVLVVAAGAGYVVVRRSLQPLTRIEGTAAAIAAGDLAQRVPPEPSTTEVGSLSGSLNLMLGRLESAFEERAANERRMQRFVSDASHELRTPLAALRGYAELYRLGGIPPDDVPAVMERLERESVRMTALVHDLLTLARLDEGRAPRLGPVDLHRLVTDAAHDLRALDPARQVRVVAGPGDWIVEGDGDQLRQVLLNLVGNVASYTPAGSPAELTLTREASGDVVISVADHGPGIPAADADRVFDRFFRIETSRSRARGGSGLGLAIVAAIVTAHHGRVSVTETPGGGATIHVALPAHAAPEA